MRKLLLAFIFTLVSGVAFADSTLTINGHSISGLSESQIADLQKKAVDMADNNKSGETPHMIAQVSQYAELGKSIGAGLASTAKELGVAVNDFANSPIGRIATFIIIFKLIGSKIIEMTVGFLWLICMIPLWVYMFKRLGLIEAVQTETFMDDKGKSRKVKRVEYLTNVCESVHITRFIMAFVLGIIVFIGFAVI